MAARGWQQSGSHWERQSTAMETIYTAISSGVPDGSPAHWVVSSGLKFTYNGSDSDASLTSQFRRAWLDMRRRFPNMAAKSSGGKRIFTPLANTDAEDWLKQTFRVHTDVSIDELLANAIKNPHIVLHFLPKSQHLLLQATHDFIDGRGSLYLWDAFFATLAGIESEIIGEDVSRLPLSEDQLLDTPQQPSERDLQGVERFLDRCVVTEPIGMPVSVSNPPGPNFRRELRLDVDLSQSVIRACKAKGVTVTSAWHAASILTTQKIQGEAAGHSAGNAFSAFTNFDMRTYFPADFKPRENPIGTYHVGYPFRIERPGERGFNDILQEIQWEYKTTFTADKLKFMPAVVQPALELFSKAPAPSSTPIHSSIGILEKFMQHAYGAEWAVEDVWIADNMLTPEIISFLWSWKGQIVLSGSCNASYYTEGDLDGYLERVRDELLAGLEIQKP